MKVPHYEELSVKNLYQDAIKNKDVAPYLPSLEQNSGKLPERHFFFGVLATVKPDYLKSIIKDAQMNRHKGDD